MGRKKQTSELHYYGERLSVKLEQFSSFSSIIVEAPSGYGKTTAVQDYLKASASRNEVCWVTAVAEAPAALYGRLCREIDKIDARSGARLLKIDFPNAFTIGEVCDALRTLECERDVWLVIDNYEFLTGCLPPSFLAALIEHGGRGLHVVILTQMLSRDDRGALAGKRFLSVNVADLRFTAGDIRRYYALAGTMLSEEQLRQVLSYTEGWAIAVYMQLRAYWESGAFSDAAILLLMEHLVWDKLTAQQQQFLLYLSPFDALNVRQICGIHGFDALPDYAADCLDGPFIQYKPEQRLYEPHGLLRELLIQKRAERGAAFERDCLAQAGDWCRTEAGRAQEALAFYVQIGDYRRIFTLDLAQMIFQEIGDRTFFDIALQIAKDCPQEIRRAHPLPMLCVAWALKSAGRHDVFSALMAELDEQLDEDGPLRAEWTLLSCYTHFPHVDRMLASVMRAAPLFQGTCSRVILPEALWCFGNYCQLAEFHTTPGGADAAADLLDAFIALYARLTNGHGSGADAVYRSELAFYRGDLGRTEIYAYKAAHQAEAKRQGIILLEAARMLAEIALLRADTALWQRAIEMMERAATYEAQNTFLFRAVLDTVRGVLLSEMSEHGRIAEWIRKGEFSARLNTPIASNALTVHLLVLMLRGEFLRLIGTIGAIPQEDISKTAFVELLVSLILAVGHAAIGDLAQARALVEHAAEKSIPDGLVYLFASLSWLLHGLCEELFEHKYPHLLERYSQVKRQFGQGWEVLRDALFKGELPTDLTPREREIALLASDGLHNAEIAKQLFVTESTVRAHLRTIFQKLDIDRRAKLVEKLR